MDVLACSDVSALSASGSEVCLGALLVQVWKKVLANLRSLNLRYPTPARRAASGRRHASGAWEAIGYYYLWASSG